jgi:hypothetical protein
MEIQKTPCCVSVVIYRDIVTSQIHSYVLYIVRKIPIIYLKCLNMQTSYYTLSYRFEIIPVFYRMQ